MEKMMRAIFALFFFGVTSSTYAQGQTIICWDRNISMVATTFSSVPLADTLYPIYVKLWLMWVKYTAKAMIWKYAGAGSRK